MRRERARLHAQQISLHHVIERCAQAAVVVILERHEAERLQDALSRFARRAQDFGHAVHRPGLSLERDFYEVALAQRLRYAQQASGHGDGLEFSFGAAAVFEPNRSQNGISELDAGCAPRWMRLGEVGHSQVYYRTMRYCVTDY
jgi:hypothetical protein